MAYHCLHWFPLALVVLLPLTFVITYTWSVLLGDVVPGFPYISDTGTNPPVSCVFSQLLNVAAVLLGVCIYLRYRQVAELIGASERQQRSATTINAVTGCLGAAASAGLSLVANFQESNVGVVHAIGADVTFIGGALYFCLQTWLSYSLRSAVVGRFTLYLQGCMSCLCILCAATTIASGSVARSQFHGVATIKWGPDDGGWGPHLLSTISEWLLAVLFASFFVSYVREFSYLSMEPPQFQLHFKSAS
ncbi:DNA damage-regulated autophagy modulator protein 2-like [Bacillus rossius redtenbacheri]|uniref:DNA damage-regulated autophagy modulator protein 2-like n=1 Tax=Bacillus rossius redtenbacheri TaxID=93214 RepID=UPI002FDEAB12